VRVCIISGTYNPGKCGISDYICLLSDKLRDLGHDVSHASVHHIDKPNDLIQNYPNHDLYSIQFAPYAFSPNGVLDKNSLNLAKSLNSQKTHINFHEIWIGAYPKASLKEKFRGWRQKLKILSFLHNLNPNFITSTNSAAIDRLSLAGIETEYLYLFGNIPLSQTYKLEDKKSCDLAIFGTPYENFPYRLLGQKIKELSESLKLPINIYIIGIQREIKGLNHIKKFSKDYDFSVVECGELSAKQISKELAQCDLGISTTPYDVIGKSGATAAILEHRLPLIVYDDGDTPAEKLFVLDEFSNQIYFLDSEQLISELTACFNKKRQPFFDGVAYTANQMLRLVS
jgi:hypothetical protein